MKRGKLLNERSKWKNAGVAYLGDIKAARSNQARVCFAAANWHLYWHITKLGIMVVFL